MHAFDPSGLWVIAVCIAAGWGLRHYKQVPSDAHRVLNRYILFIPLPCLILLKIHGLVRGEIPVSHAWLPASMAWIQFLVSWLIFSQLGRFFGWKRVTVGALIITAGLGNTSFVGFPLLQALLGPDALSVGIIADQLGSFLVFSTLGVVVASLYSGKKARLGTIIKKAFSFAPLWALLIAVVLSPVSFPSMISGALTQIAASLIPVALVSVGLQLKFSRLALRALILPMGLGLFFKLVLFPFLMLGAFQMLQVPKDLTWKVTLLEAAMAPMITGAVLAEEAGLDAELAGMMVALGIPISIFTILGWAYCL